MEHVLQEIGLSPNEARIYQSLVRLGQQPVSAISKSTGVHRRNVYDSMNRLIEKGLVFQVFSTSENFFEAVHPDKLMELVREKEEKLKEALPKLIEDFDTTPHPEEVFIYKGIEGFKNFLRDVLRIGDDMYIIGAKGFWFDPRLKQFTKSFIKEAKSKKIKFHSIFDHEVQSEMEDILKTVPKPHRFFPKGYSTRLSVNVFGDRVVRFTGAGLGDLGPDITLFITVNKPMAEAYRVLFSFIWEHCKASGRN